VSQLSFRPADGDFPSCSAFLLPVKFPMIFIVFFFLFISLAQRNGFLVSLQDGSPFAFEWSIIARLGREPFPVWHSWPGKECPNFFPPNNTRFLMVCCPGPLSRVVAPTHHLRVFVFFPEFSNEVLSFPKSIPWLVAVPPFPRP